MLQKKAKGFLLKTAYSWLDLTLYWKWDMGLNHLKQKKTEQGGYFEAVHSENALF